MIAQRNADLEPGQRIELRVGVDLGDVTIDGDDTYGDGVNVVAWLEGLARPGGRLPLGRGSCSGLTRAPA